MKKVLTAIFTLSVVFLYRIYVDYSSTGYPLNIAGAFGESLVYFLLAYPIVLLIQVGISKNKEPVKKNYYDEMISDCIAIVKLYASEGNWIFTTIDNKENLSNWIDYISEDVREITNADKKNKILKLREKTIKMLDRTLMYAPLIGETRNEEEKKTITNSLMQGKSYDETLLHVIQSYVYSEASIACFRLKSIELGDAKKDDWFDVYKYIYNMLITQLHDTLISESTKEECLSSLLVPITQQMAQEIKKGILEGQEYNYNELIEMLNEEKNHETLIEKSLYKS